MAGLAVELALPDVVGRVAALEEALVVGGDRLEPAAVARARAALERAGQRLRLGADLTVVALVGATGGGKSSLFNALAAMEISEVAARRPTTSEAMACVWEAESSDALLDWLGVPARNRTRRASVLDADRVASLHGLVLLDLPDHDSAFVAHRLEVDRLVEQVDLMVWVVDPQKYADESLHTGYLKPLAGRDEVMLVVLNQVDKLGPAETETCLRDLRRLLDADGLEHVQVLATSALNGAGVDGLREVIAGVVQGRQTALDRALGDLAAAAADLRACTGPVEPDPRVLPGSAELVAALGDAAGLPVVLDAVESDYRRRAARQLDWPFLRWGRWLRPDPLARVELAGAEEELRALTRDALPEPTPSQKAQVDLAVRGLAAAMAARMPPRWAKAVQSAASRPGEDLSGALDAVVAGVDLRLERPGWWRPLELAELAAAGIAMFGFIWLVVIGVVDWVRVSAYTPPFVGPLPVPTAMLVVGLLVGAGLAVVARTMTLRGAVARREAVTTQTQQAVQDLTWSRVLAPVAAVLADHRTVRESLEAIG